MQTLALYALVTAAVHYLLGFAKITSRLRDPLPDTVVSWLYCPFCSGFWYGLLLAAGLGNRCHLELLGLPGDTWYTPLLAGFVTMITTPILIGVAFRQHYIAHAISAGEAAAAPEPVPPRQDGGPPGLRAV